MLLPVIIYSPVHLINQSFTISYIVLPPFATTATRQPDILAELHNFFKWKPPVLKLTPTASQSKASHKLLMSLLIRYANIPFYFCFSFAFSTLSIHHYAPPLWCNHTTIALASSDRSHLFDGHMTYDSHVFTSILSISNVPPPVVQPITSSHTTWSGTFNNFALSSHSCLPFVFNLPVFYLLIRTSSPKPQTIAYPSFPQNLDLALTPCTVSHLFCTILHHIALPRSHHLYLPQYTWRQSLAPRSHPLRAPKDLYLDLWLHRSMLHPRHISRENPSGKTNTVQKLLSIVSTVPDESS